MEHYITVQRRFSREVPGEPPFDDANYLVAPVHAIDREPSVLVGNDPSYTRKGKAKAKDESN